MSAQDTTLLTYVDLQRAHVTCNPHIATKILFFVPAVIAVEAQEDNGHRRIWLSEDKHF